jgi:hypothetical protein
MADNAMPGVGFRTQAESPVVILRPHDSLQCQTKRGKHSLYVELRRRSNPRIEEVSHENLRRLFEYGLHAILGDRDPADPMMAPEVPENMIERGPSARSCSKLEVEKRTDELSFPVIADGAIERIFVRSVELDPSVEACALEG